jgi:hypothetical protein
MAVPLIELVAASVQSVNLGFALGFIK